MNLDLAIQNTLKRSPMEGAMHGVLSNFGAQYELRSYTENAGLADQLFGDSVGVTAPVGDAQLSKAVLPDDATFAPPTMQGFNQVLNINGETYTVSYATANNNFSLTKLRPSTGFDRFVNWFKSGGKDTDTSTVLITKYGGDSGHRFLTSVEESDLNDDVKNAVISEVLANMSPEITAVIQVPSQTEMSLAGTSPVSSQSMNQSNVMEMDLASEYRGVQKLKSDHFMGDTIVPTPLSHIQSGMLRNAEGFNQNPVGQHIAPPTKLAGAPRKNSRSL
mgnify:CR=1 FL=1|jgi:hypothetical protein|tara:strand:- start:4257 stop:5084 length:828 start_codon:yes stop_codon:yes gene_type:complete